MKKSSRDSSLADRIKVFDFYKDLPQDLAEPSVSGATGTIKLILILNNSVNVCYGAYDSIVHLTNFQFYAVLEDKRDFD